MNQLRRASEASVHREPRARSLGVCRPLSRPAIEIGFGLGKDRDRRRPGIHLPNPKAQSFAPPEGEGERRCGGAAVSGNLLRLGPSAPRPFPLAPSRRSFPRWRHRPSQPPSPPPPSPPPARPPPFLCRLFFFSFTGWCDELTRGP
ncbi:hypothetical protein mRhiFer1_008344 [Rhinolophus ferrumequinum]|uniref:Uncharacterized protein n=1 Tax=Rhinolophus ferrumequinum TaxID=59479 RepID=A0A7J7VEA6_RHIFE|nr:hypothetical protein mRhiFer1_008344 [Rhinolophus ferrumequinum]